MNQPSMNYNLFEETSISRMLRELQSNLADAVEDGSMTPTEANQWAQGLS